VNPKDTIENYKPKPTPTPAAIRISPIITNDFTAVIECCDNEIDMKDALCDYKVVGKVDDYSVIIQLKSGKTVRFTIAVNP
jgi:hypothetical protein